VILEGLHALNPLLATNFPKESKFGLFIEPITQPVVFATTPLRPTEARLLRRIVRDNRYRKMSPADTFRMWPKVIDGEKKWILPFRDLADAEFDSGLVYELTVLKPFVAGLLQKYLIQTPGNALAHTLLEILCSVRETDPTKVPGDSILRETIGGSQLEY
jgi:uridine kinase